jgi:hypothetical protein
MEKFLNSTSSPTGKTRSHGTFAMIFIGTIAGIGLLTWINYKETGSLWPIRGIKKLLNKVDE